MKTAIEVLTKYSDGDYTQFKGHENILLAMQEYAEQYHEAKMKEEYSPEKREAFIQAVFEEKLGDELRNFLSSMNQGIAYGLNEWAIKDYANNYLATRKNK